ncbi:MAG: hypothetical protein ACXVFV_08980 [Mycobacteriales bacterium]
MSDSEGTPVRRLRAVAEGEQAPETAGSVLPGVPRIGPLDALLREVDGLRLSLETDLGLAADAVEAGAPQAALDLVVAERAGLRDFEDRALAHLADLAGDELPPRARRRWWSRVPAAPFVAAAAVVGFLVGVVPHTTGTPTAPLTASPASASQSLAELAQLAAQGQTAEVRTAANALHSQLLALVAEARTNPAAARQGLLLLSAERAVIAQSGDSSALGDVLAASTHLSRLILSALPAAAPTAPAQPAVVVPTPGRASSSPAPASSPAPRTSSAPASPAPKPSSSPTPRPSSSSGSGSGGVLPTAPAFSP